MVVKLIPLLHGADGDADTGRISFVARTANRPKLQQQQWQKQQQWASRSPETKDGRPEEVGVVGRAVDVEVEVEIGRESTMPETKRADLSVGQCAAHVTSTNFYKNANYGLTGGAGRGNTCRRCFGIYIPSLIFPSGCRASEGMVYEYM